MRASAIAAETGIADLKAFLVGRWRLSRMILDRRAGDHGSFEGTAVFRVENDGLIYLEQGVFKLGGYEGPAKQLHHYRFPKPWRAEVSFAHGGFFHDLDLSRGFWAAEHLCGADTYNGTFHAEGSDRWEAVWRVTGPRKDQELTTRYLRDD